MKIKELSKIWLPKDANPNDLVLGATHIPGARAHIMLSIRKKNGRRDSLLLILPANVLQTALVTINETQGLTVREIGDLDLPIV